MIMIKAILFDYDETLVQTLNSKIPAYIALAKERYHFNLSEDTIRKSIGKPYEEFVYSLYGDVDKVENIIQIYRDEYSPKFPNMLYPKCLETVNSLLKKYKVGILSGYSRDIILTDLKRLAFPVDQMFHIQTMEDSPYRKPNPKVFDPLFVVSDKLVISKEEILYIGDDLRDYEAASSAGVKFIAISDHTTKKDVFEKNNITNIKHFEELPALIETVGIE